MPTLKPAELADAIEGANNLILRWGHGQMRQLQAVEVESIVAALKASASSETGQLVTSRTSADLRRFFDRVAEESLGDYPWKVETALLAVYRLGREDERGERQGGS